MTEYIEREALLRYAEQMAEFRQYMASVYDLESLVIGMKPADVAPVRHGRWNADETCSFCGKKSTEGLDAEKWNYWFPDFCPNCGAKMDGGE